MTGVMATASADARRKSRVPMSFTRRRLIARTGPAAACGDRAVMVDAARESRSQSPEIEGSIRLRTQAALGDARIGAGPAGVEGAARLVEIDDDRRVVRRDGLALARLAVDLGPFDASGERPRHQAVVDAHAEVLVEHAGAVVPPAVALRLVMDEAIGVDEPPVEQ